MKNEKASGHPSIRSLSLYLNFLGPDAARPLARFLRSPAKAKHFRVLNLQFTDVATDERKPNKQGVRAPLAHVQEALRSAAEHGGVRLEM